MAKKSNSRAARWAEACGKAREGLEELQSIKEEYEEWKDNLPENLASSPLGEKLEAVCEIDIEEAINIIDDADGLDLPRGFGRD